MLARGLAFPDLTRLRVPGPLPLANPGLAQEVAVVTLWGRERTMLTVAMESPLDHTARLDRLTQETGLRIFPVLTHPHALAAALEQFVESVHGPCSLERARARCCSHAKMCGKHLPTASDLFTYLVFKVYRILLFVEAQRGYA